MAPDPEDIRTWQRGSIEYFRNEWIKQRTNRQHIYPRSNPQNQWDAFEYLKARRYLELVQQSIPPGGSILEYGCGAAGMLIYLANHGYCGTALDATSEALEIARGNARTELPDTLASTLQYVVSDALNMPFASDSFDVVMSNGLLEHFSPDVVPDLLAEVYRVLKPSGLFIADIVHRRFSTRQIAKPLNFIPSYLKQVVSGHGLALSAPWSAVSNPMYENNFNRKDWLRALANARLKDVKVSTFRLPPPLSLPSPADRLYGRAIVGLAPLKWLASPQDFSIPLAWVYLATGTK